MSHEMRFTRAGDVFDAFPAAHEDISVPPSNGTPLEFIDELLTSPTPENAVTFCAYLLGRRESVWWGHQCLHAVKETLTPDDELLLALAEDWVREPEEEQRNAALEAGMATSLKTPGAWIALGAGWSGGSMTAPDAAPVPPPPHLTAKAVNAGVLSALARVPSARRSAMLQTFVTMGVQLATGQA